MHEKGAPGSTGRPFWQSDAEDAYAAILLASLATPDLRLAA